MFQERSFNVQKNQVKTEMSAGLDCRGNRGWDGGKAVGRGITGSERVEKASVDNTLEGWPGGKTRVREGKEGRHGLIKDPRAVCVVGKTGQFTCRWEHTAVGQTVGAEAELTDGVWGPAQEEGVQNRGGTKAALPGNQAPAQRGVAGSPGVYKCWRTDWL